MTHFFNKVFLSGLVSLGTCLWLIQANTFNQRTGGSIEEQQHIEMFKYRLLSKLNMKEPPVLNSTHSAQALWQQLPLFAQKKLINEANAVAVEPIEEAILVVDPMLRCPVDKLASCFVINIKDDISRTSLISVKFEAETNVQDVKGRYLELWEILHHGDRVEYLKLLSEVVVSTEDGVQPVSLDITSDFYRWKRERDLSTTQRRVSRSVMLVCADCESKNGNPVMMNHVVIEIKVKNKRLARSKRHYDCHPKSPIFKCCLYTFEVNFRQIKWDHWIVYPLFFSPNFCSGSCQNAPPDSNHAEIMQAYIDNNYHKHNHHQRLDMQTCCSGRTFKSLTIIYSSDGKLILRELPDIVIENCGCF